MEGAGGLAEPLGTPLPPTQAPSCGADLAALLLTSACSSVSRAAPGWCIISAPFRGSQPPAASPLLTAPRPETRGVLWQRPRGRAPHRPTCFHLGRPSEYPWQCLRCHRHQKKMQRIKANKSLPPLQSLRKCQGVKALTGGAHGNAPPRGINCRSTGP